MLVRKEQKRKVHSLIDKVWNWKNLNEAWKKVKKNKGAAGICITSMKGWQNLAMR
jgi:hypothetical protein